MAHSETTNEWSERANKTKRSAILHTQNDTFPTSILSHFWPRWQNTPDEWIFQAQDTHVQSSAHTHRLSTRINLRIKNPLWIAYVMLASAMGLPQWCPLALLKRTETGMREKKRLFPACVLVIPFATSNFVHCLLAHESQAHPPCTE